MELPRRHKKSTLIAVAVAVVALTARSALRSSDWINGETFYRRTFAAGATNSRIGVNLGVIYATQGRHAEAEKILRKVLQVTPNYPVARNNLGLALAAQGRMLEAETFFRSAAAATDDAAMREPTWDAALHLARSYFANNDPAAALAMLGSARRRYPRTWELVRFECEILRATAGSDAALSTLEGFVGSNWWHAGAAIALGRAYLEKGDLVRAEAAFRQASRLDVHDAESISLMSLTKLRQGQPDAACLLQRRAVARQPNEARQYLILADVLSKTGRSDEARATLAKLDKMRTLSEADVQRTQ
jgi:superkiller protein 3